MKPASYQSRAIRTGAQVAISHQVPSPSPSPSHGEHCQMQLAQNRAYPHFIHAINIPAVNNEYGEQGNMDPTYAVPMERVERGVLPYHPQCRNYLPQQVPTKVGEPADEPAEDHDYEDI